MVHLDFQSVYFCAEKEANTYLVSVKSNRWMNVYLFVKILHCNVCCVQKTNFTYYISYTLCLTVWWHFYCNYRLWDSIPLTPKGIDSNMTGIYHSLNHYIPFWSYSTTHGRIFYAFCLVSLL